MADNTNNGGYNGAANDDVAFSASIDCSGYDQVSADCKPDNCDCKYATVTPGEVEGTDQDYTRWQSPPVKPFANNTCPEQWIRFSLESRSDIRLITVLYGTDWSTFDGQTVGQATYAPRLTVTRTDANGNVIVADAAQNSDFSFSSVKSNQGRQARVDLMDCKDGSLWKNVSSVQISFDRDVPFTTAAGPNLCQVNIEAVQIHAGAAAGASSPSSSPQLTSSALGGVIAAAVIAAILVPIAIVLIVRRRNLEKKKRMERLRNASGPI